jgi:hypothetical protein
MTLNIFSGEHGLGGALTNPTELARQKGCIQQQYPVVFRGRRFPDAETAYHVLKETTPEANDALMVYIIAAKLLQNEALLTAITRRGGTPFLETCSHLTGARSEGSQSWEGVGRQSRFIRNLIAGYELALTGNGDEPVSQMALF